MKHLTILAALLLTASQLHSQQQLPKWDFEDGLQGWTPNGAIEDLRVENGILKGKVIAHDPHIFSPFFKYVPDIHDRITLRIKTTKPGQGQLYYSDNTNPPYKGFTGNRVINFYIDSTDTWQTISFKPYLVSENPLIHFRLDFPNNVEFEVDYLEVVPASSSSVSKKHSWTFVDNKNEEWFLEEKGVLFSPALSLNTKEYDYMIFTLDTSGQAWVEMQFFTDGSGRKIIPLVTSLFDHGEHTYTVQLAGTPFWQGNLKACSIQVTTEYGKPYKLANVQFSKEPWKGNDVAVLFFGAENFPNRVNKPNRVLLKIQNLSANPAEVKAKFTLPPKQGSITVDGKATEEVSVVIEGNEVATIPFEITTQEPGMVEPSASLMINNAKTIVRSAKPFQVTAPPVVKSDYIPEPVPAKTDYLIGSYYYPGYGTNYQWQQMALFAPQTKPVLGYYDEGNPECIDWQIKWALEHGVNFFLVDWYWQAGIARNMHWLKGFYQAKFKSAFKWAIMWANHNAPKTHSREDWVNVVNFWLDNYLKTPEYLTLHGKPVVFMWNTRNIISDLGGIEPASELFKLADKMATDAGLPGIHFYALNSGATETLVKMGYKGLTSYHWWANASLTSQNQKFYSYQAVVDKAPPAWNRMQDDAKRHDLEFIPVGDTGWDARPRHNLNTFVIYDRTPQLFKKHLQDLKEYLDRNNQKIAVLGPWNEWTEGSYIEPCSEWGFEMVRAIRDVFCKETTPSSDVSPTDIVRGPYDFELDLHLMKLTEWNFEKEQALLGWRRLMNLENMTVTRSGLEFDTITRDAALLSAPLTLMAKDYSALEVEMSVSPAASDDSQVVAAFWATTASPITGQSTSTVKLKQTADMVKYVIPLEGHPLWRGKITQLRFDPNQQGGVHVVIKSIRLVEK